LGKVGHNQLFEEAIPKQLADNGANKKLEKLIT
jgi:hypothetical protein